MVTQPQGDGGADFWMGKSIGEALAKSQDTVKAAGEGADRWQVVGKLVQQLAAAVTDGHKVATAAALAAGESRRAATGVWLEWGKILPRLKQHKFLLGGGFSASCLTVWLFTITPAIQEASLLQREMKATALPDAERYAELAEVEKLRGNDKASAWFNARSRNSRSPDPTSRG